MSASDRFGTDKSRSDPVSHSIAGARSLGRTPGCDTGTAWVFFADGFYAEVQPSDGDLSAVGIWRDEGEVIAYTMTISPSNGMRGQCKCAILRSKIVARDGPSPATIEVSGTWKPETLQISRCSGNLEPRNLANIEVSDTLEP